MKAKTFCALFLSFVAALSNPSNTTTLSKRHDEMDEGVYCYSLGDWDWKGFSAFCPPTSWPITNDKGLNVMGVLYFALVGTTLPDDTIYEAEENIICTVNEPTPKITAEVGADAGYGPVSGGGSVEFELTSVNTGDNSICMFTEGSEDKAAAPNITLAQARERLYELITTPNVNCETCGQIRIQPDNAARNSSDPGAILKIDVRSANNCLGKCVGPNSFSETTATPTPTPTPSPTASESVGGRVVPALGWAAHAVFASVSVGSAWLIGAGIFGIMAGW